VTVNVQKLDEIVDKANKESLSIEECELLKTSIHAMAERLVPSPRSSEKAAKLLKGQDEGQAEEQNATATPPSKAPKKPRPGHGRNGADAYVGATVIPVLHPDLAPQCLCPGCCKGKLYERDSRPLLRIVGMPPIQGTRYNLQELRCNLCGELYPAPAPEGIGEAKYDESVTSMVAVLKYGQGVPFNRLANLQHLMGVPLPAGTQCDLMAAAAEKLEPVLDELTRQAAQGTVLYHDDTGVRILDDVPCPPDHDEDRTGLHTTGTVSLVENHKIALFTSGPQHAGENMRDLLEQRKPEQPPPVLMSDGLSHNVPKVPATLELVLSNCLAHGRRKFADIFEAFPEECRHVIEQLGLVYWHDEQARAQSMDDQARLAFHQIKSGPVMDDLRSWMAAQIENKKTEPNSSLGKAIGYFTKRWDRLTLFLRHPGAPLDNNVAERALKKAVLHRKNSMFFKTLNGAHIADLFMTLIYTCELNRINPFRYLTDLQRHAAEAQADPSQWLPWNFQTQLQPSPTEPGDPSGRGP